MLIKLNRAALALSTLAASAILASANPALAGTEVSIKPNGFSPIPIVVLSEDGKKWTKVKNKQLLLNVTIGIGRTDQEVIGFKVRQGWPPQASTQPWQHVENYENAPARVDKNLTISGSTDNFTPAERTKILKACNANLVTGGSINQTYNLFYGVKVQLLGLFTDSTPGMNIGRVPGKYGNGTATVKVICKGARDLPGGLATEEPKELKVGSIELFRSTFANATSQPNPGTVCKKARLLVRLKTNKIGPVKFKLWTRIGNQPMTSKVVDAVSQFTGPGQFKAEYTEWVSVNKTSFVQAMAEDMTNPIGQSSGWKSITLNCTGAGGGGLADVPNPNDEGPLVSPLKVTGELTLADKAGAPKDKPRLGQAVFKIWATKPGATSYRLTCSGSRKWEGTLPTFKVGNKKYQAVGAANFQIAKTEQIGCALRSTSLNGDPVIAIATRLFKLVKRNPNVSGPGGITGKPKPTTGKPNKRPAVIVTPKPPKKPAIKVAPLRKTVCIGGKVSRNSCFCPARTKQVKIGANAYRCIVNVVKPKAPPKKVILVAPPKRAAPAIRTAPVKRKTFIGKKR